MRLGLARNSVNNQLPTASTSFNSNNNSNKSINTALLNMFELNSSTSKLDASESFQLPQATADGES